MKTKLLLALLVSAFTYVQACAQTTPSDEPTTASREQRMRMTPEQRAERQTKHMVKQLSLSSDQERAVAAINLKYAKEMQTLFDGDRSQDNRKKAKDLMASKDEELKKVLNESQYKQYDELKDARRDRMKQGHGRRASK